MYLYNSLTHKKELFVPNDPDLVKMYTCGPTVYHYAHIGNLRTYIMEDVLEKSLRYLGYNVKRVMNITDVGHLASDADTGEDKMLKGARREHKTVMEIAKYFTDAFFADDPSIRADAAEKELIGLWKRYFAAADVKSRPHPKQQDGYLPRRYRKNMSEFQ